MGEHKTKDCPRPKQTARQQIKLLIERSSSNTRSWLSFFLFDRLTPARLENEEGLGILASIQAAPSPATAKRGAPLRHDPINELIGKRKCGRRAERPLLMQKSLGNDPRGTMRSAAPCQRVESAAGAASPNSRAFPSCRTHRASPALIGVPARRPS